MSVLPVLFGWPLILLPVHIVFLEFIIDPACSVVFETEPEEADVMRRRPRSVNAKLFYKGAAVISFIQGVAVLAIVVLVFVSTNWRGLGEETARTMAFATIVAANLALIWTNRSWAQTIVGTFRRPNKAFWWILALALFALGLVIYVPPLSSLFRFSALNPIDFLICLGAGLVSIAWFEIFKVVKKRSVGK
jgi:Ca2+-transporting ATPase